MSAGMSSERPRCAHIHPSRRQCSNTAVIGNHCWTHTPNAPGCHWCLGRNLGLTHNCRNFDSIEEGT